MNHSSYWGQVSQLLLAFEGIPEFERPPSLTIQTSTSPMALQHRILLAEDPIVSDLEMAVRAWPDDREPWTRLGELGAYFLKLRAESSLEFVSMVIGGFDTEGAHLFPGPDDVAPVEFARYLLTDWWSSAGRGIAAKSLLLKHRATQ